MLTEPAHPPAPFCLLRLPHPTAFARRNARHVSPALYYCRVFASRRTPPKPDWHISCAPLSVRRRQAHGQTIVAGKLDTSCRILLSYSLRVMSARCASSDAIHAAVRGNAVVERTRG